MENITSKKNLVGLIHKVYITLLKKKRKYKAETKTKAEVRGGGRKPWRQKGTGQARAGSIRSPLWRGGGIAFGPKPHSVSKKINKKEKRKALFASLFLKKKNVIIIEKAKLETIKSYKTKEFLKFLSEYNISNKYTTLIILNEIPLHFKRATQNLYYIDLLNAKSLNLDSILKAKKLLLADDTIPIINSNYGKIF